MAVISAHQVEMEPLPNVTPKTVASLLRIDTPEASRMLEALKVFHGIDYILLLKWAAAKGLRDASSVKTHMCAKQESMKKILNQIQSNIKEHIFLPKI